MQAPAAKSSAASSRAAAAVSGHSKKSLYFEVAYVPTQDNELVDGEFFRRVCAGHYVLTCAEPSRKLLEAIIEGKKAYLSDNKLNEPPSPTVIIPTYESTTLLAWKQYSAAELQSLRIEVAPATSQCVIQLQSGATGMDSDNQCRAFRLEF